MTRNGNLPRSSRSRPAGGRSHGHRSLSAGAVTVPEHSLPLPTRHHGRRASATPCLATRLKLNSPCTAGKSCSARDLNQLSVCLLVVCLVTTTVGEAYLVRTIGRRSESQPAPLSEQSARMPRG